MQNENAARFCQACGKELYAATGGASAVASSGVYAGFWQRFAAFIIDVAIVSVGTGILTAITFGNGSLAFIFAPWVYEALMLSSVKQATLGKIALGLIVTDMNGNKITFGRATGRHFAKYVSGFILFIGFIMAAFTERKQALHDMMAQTLVVIRQ
jgi:uncharacterized RDD family membrane protein YckC